MGFKLLKKDTIKKKVPIEIPGDFDRIERADLIVTFKKLPVSRFKELLDRLKDDESGLTDFDLLRDHIEDVENLEDEKGKPVDFTPDVLDQLLEASYVLQPLVKAFLEVQADQRGEKRKN